MEVCKVIIFLFTFLVINKVAADVDLFDEVAKIKTVLAAHDDKMSNVQLENKFLRNFVQKQGAEIARLKRLVDRLQITISGMRKDTQGRKEMNHYEDINTPVSSLAVEEEKDADQNEGGIRRVSRVQPRDSGAVAFYAYMSSDEAHPSIHHLMAFDVVITNVGNAYNNNTGSFTAPSSGLYVFTCTFYNAGLYMRYEILRNSEVIGGVNSDSNPHNVYADSDSSTVVVYLHGGDNVYIRTSWLSKAGAVLGGLIHPSSFAGWRII